MPPLVAAGRKAPPHVQGGRAEGPLRRGAPGKEERFKVEHLGMLLAEHETFCASRSGNERISSGVRWRLW